ALGEVGASARDLDLGARSGDQIVTTGVGSSAAHARLLASALTELGAPARFASLGALLAPPTRGARESVLIVFSQGLSPNARVALAHPAEWRSVCLVTSASLPHARGSDAPDIRERREALSKLRAGGVRVVTHAGGEEYGTLLRVVGPMIGYAAVLRIACA